MVISPWNLGTNNSISIPEIICHRISVHAMSQRYVTSTGISHESFAILIRQPVLRLGGCQEVKVSVTAPIIRYHNSVSQNGNRSIIIPPSLYALYAAT